MYMNTCVHMYIYVCVFWLHLEAFSLLVPQLGLRLLPLAEKVPCLNH